MGRIIHRTKRFLSLLLILFLFPAAAKIDLSADLPALWRGEASGHIAPLTLEWNTSVFLLDKRSSFDGLEKLFKDLFLQGRFELDISKGCAPSFAAYTPSCIHHIDYFEVPIRAPPV